MATEVELKYLVLSDNVSQRIFEALTTHDLIFTHQVKELSNCYFDTVELTLRHMDMGLRVRSSDSHIEQTLKTSGMVIGGLHQRPEYNVDIDSQFPELNLFPDELWENKQQVSEIQSRLRSLFNTDFVREIWTVTYQSSVIELAFDTGAILANSQQLDICEIELELVSGDRDALFSLAKILFKTLELRVGGDSKAKRGYRLFAGNTTPLSTKLVLDIESKRHQLPHYFFEGIGQCLQQLQQCIDKYLSTHDYHDLAELVDVLSLLRHGFWLFDGSLTAKCESIRESLNHFIKLFAWVDNAIYLQELMNKTGNYRKKLDYSEQLIEQLRLEKRRIPDINMVSELLHSESFNVLQLELLELAISTSKSSYFKESCVDEDVVKFAQTKLSESLTLLHAAMTSLTSLNAEQYLEQRQALRRSLLTGNWFGQLFVETDRQQYRSPWVDMMFGLRELQSLWIIKQQLQKLDDNSDTCYQKIINWQHSKVEGLLVAIEQSKQAATAISPYWLE